MKNRVILLKTIDDQVIWLKCCDKRNEGKETKNEEYQVRKLIIQRHEEWSDFIQN